MGPVTGPGPVALRHHPFELFVCRLADRPAPLPSWVTDAPWWAAAHTGDERSAVVAGRPPDGVDCSGPWTPLEVAGPLPHDAVGIMAALTEPLAAAGVPVFTVATFDTDWLLVPAPRAAAACRALRGAGHRVDEAPAAGGDPGPPAVVVRQRRPEDDGWIDDLLVRYWGATVVATRGVVHRADRLPALVALRQGRRCGLCSYRVAAGALEVVALAAEPPRTGTGSALLAAVTAVARERSCRSLWLITTNDNLGALAFYQRQGLRLRAVHPGAVDEARRRKPSIPTVGEGGIPVHDEVELWLDLGGG